MHHGRVVGVEDEPAVVRLRQELGARLELGPQAVVVRVAPREISFSDFTGQVECYAPSRLLRRFTLYYAPFSRTEEGEEA